MIEWEQLAMAVVSAGALLAWIYLDSSFSGRG